MDGNFSGLGYCGLLVHLVQMRSVRRNLIVRVGAELSVAGGHVFRRGCGVLFIGLLLAEPLLQNPVRHVAYIQYIRSVVN